MNNIKLWTRQHSPELLLASGIINSAAAIVLASVATKKLSKVTTPVKKDIIKIHTKMDKLEKESDEAKQLKTKLNRLYFKTGLKITGMYAPAVIAFGLSTASMIGSHNILKGRNAALAAALVTLKSGYDAYRDRVKEKIGEKAEEEIYLGMDEKKITEVDENGKKETKTLSTVLDKREDKDFGVFWGPGNTTFDSCSNDFNMTTLLQIESFMNQKLEAEGYLFLADVFKALGCTAGMLGEHKLQASRVIGWVYDKNDHRYDNYVSFGLHDKNGELTKAAKRFQQGLDEFIWLEFNVDGDILTGDYNERTFMKAAVRKDQ